MRFLGARLNISSMFNANLKSILLKKFQEILPAKGPLEERKQITQEKFGVHLKHFKKDLDTTKSLLVWGYES